MVSLKTAELKFLLKLLGCENYRGAIASLSPNSKTSSAERDRICQSLQEKGLVDYDREVGRFAIAPPGRTLLALDNKKLLLTPDEQKVLHRCRGSMTPGKLSKIPVESRQPMILSLAERGLIKITKNTIKTVWLSAEGKQFLLHDYRPTGSYPVATGALLCHYVQFLRSHLGSTPDAPNVGSDSASEKETSLSASVATAEQKTFDRKTLVQTIRQLDQALKTDNNLPLFYLREKVQPLLVREDLDEMLQALWHNNRLQLSPLRNKSQYTAAQIAAGIQQDDGNILFFITVC